MRKLFLYCFILSLFFFSFYKRNEKFIYFDIDGRSVIGEQ